MERKQRQVGPELKALSNLIKRYIDNNLVKPHEDNVTGMQGWIAGYIASRGEDDVYQRDLEAEFNMRRSTATVILQLMEKNGLIIRTSVPRDARLKKIELTQKAQKIICEIDEGIQTMEAKLAEGISDEEMRVFYTVIDKIKKNLE